MESLLSKIQNRSAAIGIIGLGYVGLPLAVEKARAGFTVVGFDVQESKVNMINDGVNYIGDIVDADLKQLVDSGQLSATNDFSFINKQDCIMICVPTPVDEHLYPNISYIKASAGEIAKYLKKDTIVILESTTYPGTTAEVLKPMLETSGLVCGQDFYLAYSPERIDPGNKIYKTKNTPKVVGGICEKSTKLAAALYEAVLGDKVFTVSSPTVAEMEKLLENTYRNINIGLANEMAILCHKMGIDIWEVIEAAKTKPYGFTAFYPGPGLGGHCIPVDPFYLTWKAREFNYHTKLIEAAAEINNYMPEFVLERTMKILNRFRKTVNGARILVLGVAYKQDIDDLRESPALDVISLLTQYGAEVCYNDPYIPNIKIREKLYASVALDEKSLRASDLTIITTMHSAYDYSFIQRHSSFIFDTKNAMKELRDRHNIEKL